MNKVQMGYEHFLPAVRSKVVMGVGRAERNGHGAHELLFSSLSLLRAPADP